MKPYDVSDTWKQECGLLQPDHTSRYISASLYVPFLGLRDMVICFRRIELLFYLFFKFQKKSKRKIGLYKRFSTKFLSIHGYNSNIIEDF